MDQSTLPRFNGPSNSTNNTNNISATINNTTTTTTNANNSNVLASYGNDHLNTYLYTMENSINHSNSSSNNNNNNNNINIDNDNHNSRHDDNSNTMINSQKAKIVAHPSFPRLLQAYTNYYKIGAPPEVITRLDEIREEYKKTSNHELSQHADTNTNSNPNPNANASSNHSLALMAASNASTSAIGDDPELDEFMHVYMELLEAHVRAVSTCLEDSRSFLRQMEAQLIITLSNLDPTVKRPASDPGASNSNINSGDDEEILDADGSCEADYNNMNINNLMSMARKSDEDDPQALQQFQQAPNTIHMNNATMNTGHMGTKYHAIATTNANLDDDDDEYNDDDGIDDEEKIRMNMSNINGLVDPILAHEDQVLLKQHLLRKYSGFMICSLKKEFLKRKKKGKLPKEARQKLLEWWTHHYKWPYPSENEKAGLAEITGLNQKQINNWFINQRKRHWKPSEDLQYVMIDSNDLHHPASQMAAMPNVLQQGASSAAAPSASNLHNNNNMSSCLNNNMLAFGSNTGSTNALI